ncbi:unknown [Dialister sp. CAG:486]|nr:unknown [Dialister sp. CAG:486]
MITGASPALSSRAKPRGLYSRRENGECKIAWKRCKPVEPSGKKTGVQERFLDFARNDDTGIRIVKHAGGWLPRMIAGASPALSSRAKSRDLYSRRENGECEIAWKRCKPVEPSGKKTVCTEDFSTSLEMTIREKAAPLAPSSGRGRRAQRDGVCLAYVE